MKPQVFFISGLGLNERVFKRLKLKDVDVIHLAWIEPKDQETISSYAQRMIQQYRLDSIPSPVMVGLSFGGIIAIEMAKLIPVKKVILISSIKHYSERPFYMSWVRFLRIYHLFSLSFYEQTIGVWGWIFGIHSKASQKIFLQMFARVSRKYLSWAITQVLIWKNERIPDHLLHIHGGRDRVFPPNFISDAHWIPDGDHGMIVHQAEEISRIILAEIYNLEK